MLIIKDSVILTKRDSSGIINMWKGNFPVQTVPKNKPLQNSRQPAFIQIRAMYALDEKDILSTMDLLISCYDNMVTM